MSNTQKTLTDHAEIKQWTEKRDGFPVAIKDTHSDNDTGVIRIAFGKNDDFEQISWDEFFNKFEEKNLALIVSANDNNDEFNKIVKRDNV
jgi:hypothetical protein